MADIDGLVEQLKAFGRDCVTHGDMTPSAERHLLQILTTPRPSTPSVVEECALCEQLIAHRQARLKVLRGSVKVLEEEIVEIRHGDRHNSYHESQKEGTDATDHRQQRDIAQQTEGQQD